MKTNSISQNNFYGVYRLPNTPKNIAEFEKFVEPMYARLRHRSCYQYAGKSPFKEAIDLIMDNITKKEGHPLSWLKMNAENHGADFSILGENILNIVTGENDIKKMLDHMASRVKNRHTFLNKIKRLFASQENLYEDKPNHLKILFYALDEVKKENEIFEKKFGPQIIQVKTTQELLTKMLTED